MLSEISNVLTEIFSTFMPYSFFAFNALLLITYIFSRIFYNFRISEKMVIYHNLFLSFQSLILVGIITYVFYISSLNNKTAIDIFLFNNRFEHPIINMLLNCFLVSKLYEWIDTMTLSRLKSRVSFSTIR